MSIPYFSSVEVHPGVFQITNAIFDDTLPTFCYLVVGSEAAMLVDSMYGVGQLKAYCRTLTQLPIIHVCTHFHGDHTGGSYEFDDVYMHPQDFESFWNRMPSSRDAAMATAQRRTLPEYRDALRIEDMIQPRVIRLHPLFEGDCIDLGDRQIEVIGAGGHTAGEIVLLDRAARCLYAGDACNCYTLLQLEGRVPVVQYRENLIRINTFRADFDTLYNGHDIRPAKIIDEGIELCGQIIEGTDDHEPYFDFGLNAYFGAKRAENSTYRADGKLFNCAYRPEWVHTPNQTQRIIKV